MLESWWERGCGESGQSSRCGHVCTQGVLGGLPWAAWLDRFIGGSVWLSEGAGSAAVSRLQWPDWNKYQFGIIRRHIIRRRQGARRRVSVNVPEWALAGFGSGPLDPHFLLEVSRSRFPIGLEVSSCLARHCGLRFPSRCQAGPGVGLGSSPLWLWFLFLPLVQPLWGQPEALGPETGKEAL